MGYNIADVSGNFTATGIQDGWQGSLDLSDPSMTIISGDFDSASLFGISEGEASDGYIFSALDTDAYGSLTVNTTDGTFTFTVDKAAVLASGSDQTVSFTIVGSSGGDSDSDTVSIELLICVARGTLIDTPSGLRPVETLVIEDLVHTKDSGPQPIRWIGSRKISGPELARNADLLPIRIAADALGDGCPSQDLLVSPQHRIVLSDWRAEIYFGQDQVLAPAKALINDQTITVDHSAAKVEYFHLLFDQHQIIRTNGLETESFHPGPYSLDGIDAAARQELYQLFPQLKQDNTAYGPAARYGLKPAEARLLRQAEA